MSDLFHLKATFTDGRTASRAATRNFVACWLDQCGRDHWTQDAARIPAGMMSAKAETVTPAEYRAIKKAARS